MNGTTLATFPPFAKGMVGVLATCVSTATLGGNVVVLIAFFVESALRIPSNYFIASLAVTDVLIGLISMNLFMTYQLLGYWPLGQIPCDIWLSLDFSACLTSQYTVFLITVDRYCSVKIPVVYRNWRTLLKVRWMICISWLFPAGLFSPVIMGWKHLTKEPPRVEGKCDVSFTYYPIFNTTLIIGYFWTTLLVMCSLYVGIYQVARRLQRKSIKAGERLATFFKSGSRQLDLRGFEEPEFQIVQEQPPDSHEKLHINDDEYPSVTRRCNPTSISTAIGNDYRDTFSGPINEQRSCKLRQVSLKSEKVETEADSDFMYSPLKTREECVDLSKLQSPTFTAHDHSHNDRISLDPNGIDVPFVVHGLNLQPNLSDSGDMTQLNRRFVDDGGARKNNRSNLNNSFEKLVNCTNLHSLFYQCHQNHNQVKDPAHKYEQLDCGTDSSHSDPRHPSITPVKIFVPSPLLPVSTNVTSTTHGSIEETKYTSGGSPVWVEQTMRSVPLEARCVHSEGCGHIESSFSDVQMVTLTDVECQCTQDSSYESYTQSPSKLLTKSDWSSSSQSESSSQSTVGVHFHCFCTHHTGMLTSEAIALMSDATSSTDSIYERISWYSRTVDVVRRITLPKSLCTFCLCHRINNPTPVQNPVEELFFHHGDNERTVGDRWKKVIGTNIVEEKSTPKFINFRCYQVPVNNRQSTHHKLDPVHKRFSMYRKENVRASLSHIRTLSGADQNSRRHARKALRTISFILGAFMICWIPYHIVMMIKGFCDDPMTQSSCVSNHFYNLTYWFCYMNSPINPFCYALSNTLFRRTFFRILRGDFQRK